MGYVVTLEGLLPSKRYDGVSWTFADLYEAADPTATFNQIDSKALTPDADPTRPAVRVLTTSNASYIRGVYKVIFRDNVGGFQQTNTISSSASLVSLDEYKALLGLDPTDNRNDAQIVALLPAASRMIRTFTDRDFELSTGASSDRTYEYDGSGYLEIDDCTAVTAVSTDGGVPATTYPLSDDEWQAQPFGGEVYYYLSILGGPYLPASPAMGFERNLDTLPFRQKAPQVTVTADWGWPTIPDDVKLATVWTIQSALAAPSGEGLSAEAIEGWSRSWGSRTAGTMSLAVPSRARDLLAAYAKVLI
jgi:hypothetical protein